MRKVLRILYAIIGALIGITVMGLVYALNIFPKENSILIVGGFILFGLIGFFSFFYFSKKWVESLIERLKKLESVFESVPVSDLVIGTTGLILGLFIAFLISQTVSKLEVPILGNIIGIIISVILYAIFGFVGIRLAIVNKDEIKRANVFKKRKYEKVEEVKDNRDKKDTKSYDRVAKILDTSVIIDGRIKDIIKTGFLEGPLIVPNFVIEELQNIADSSDSSRRERGRRGLDIVNEIKEGSKVELKIDNTDYPNIDQVDMKLLKMTKEYNGKVITNDYNLNKVAVLQEIEVLNVNELANAIKVIVYPGEHLEVNILKEGKGKSQGLGYLEDGTMIVVENGEKLIGKTIDTVVTSVIQTAAGKMIFVKPTN